MFHQQCCGGMGKAEREKRRSVSDNLKKVMSLARFRKDERSRLQSNYETHENMYRDKAMLSKQFLLFSPNSCYWFHVDM